VIPRLIEQEKLRITYDGTRKEYEIFLAATESGQLSVSCFIRESELIKQTFSPPAIHRTPIRIERSDHGIECSDVLQ
jgi:hypothetical protein